MRFRHYPATSKLQNSFLVGVPHHVFQKRSCRKPLVAMSGIFFKAPITDWLGDGLLTLKSFFWQLALSLVQCVLWPWSTLTSWSEGSKVFLQISRRFPFLLLCLSARVVEGRVPRLPRLTGKTVWTVSFCRSILTLPRFASGFLVEGVGFTIAPRCFFPICACDSRYRSTVVPKGGPDSYLALRYPDEDCCRNGFIFLRASFYKPSGPAGQPDGLREVDGRILPASFSHATWLEVCFSSI